MLSVYAYKLFEKLPKSVLVFQIVFFTNEKCLDWANEMFWFSFSERAMEEARTRRGSIESGNRKMQDKKSFLYNASRGSVENPCTESVQEAWFPSWLFGWKLLLFG